MVQIGVMLIVDVAPLARRVEALSAPIVILLRAGNGLQARVPQLGAAAAQGGGLGIGKVEDIVIVLVVGAYIRQERRLGEGILRHEAGSDAQYPGQGPDKPRRITDATGKLVIRATSASYSV